MVCDFKLNFVLNFIQGRQREIQSAGSPYFQIFCLRRALLTFGVLKLCTLKAQSVKANILHSDSNYGIINIFRDFNPGLSIINPEILVLKKNTI